MVRHCVVIALLLTACATTPPSPWRVVSSDIRPDPIENGSIGEVVYEGEAVLSGTLQPHFDPEANARCFFVDESDRDKFPRFPNDVRKPWFCFTNEDAVRRVAKPGQHARIRIADFHYRYSHTEVVNSARFVELAQR